MNWEINPDNPHENQPPEDPKSYDRRLVESLFSDGLTESPHFFINDFILKMLEISRELVAPRKTNRIKSPGKPLSPDVLSGIIVQYFTELGWTCGLDIPSDNPLGSYRLDIVAQKDWYTIIVDVRPEIGIVDFEEIASRIEYARINFSRVRFFLGTDFTNIRYLLSGDDITATLTDFAMRHQLGVIFANHDEFWLVPAEFLLINSGF